MRPLASVAGTRCTRCTPRSNLSRLHAPRPCTKRMTSLRPPTPVGLASITSTFQRWRSAYFVYMRERSAANSAASSPPAPARISRNTFLSSLGSRGSSRRLQLVLERGLARRQLVDLGLGQLAQLAVAALGQDVAGLADALRARRGTRRSARRSPGCSACSLRRRAYSAGWPIRWRDRRAARAISSERSSIWRSLSNSIAASAPPGRGTAPPRGERVARAERPGAAGRGRRAGRLPRPVGCRLYLRWKRSTRPAVSMSFCLPVKNGMALGADLDPDVGPGRAGVDDLAAGAGDGRVDVVRMNAQPSRRTS